MNTRARIASLCQSGDFYPTAEENRAEMMRRLAIALKQKPDLVCLPEAFSMPSTSGNLDGITEPLDGPTVSAFSRQARQAGCYIICPVLTQRDGHFWNTAVILDRSGDVLGVYDKLHPVTSSNDYTSMESGITPGSRVPVFDLDFGRIGVQICFDIQFPETWAELARQGARIVFWSSAYNGGFPLQSYAWQHHYYVVSSVRTDRSRIIDPLGEVLGETDYQNSLVVREINLDYAVCHYDFNYSIPDNIQAAYPGQVEIRTQWDAVHFLVEPQAPCLTIEQLKREFGFLTVQEYVGYHEGAYAALKSGRTPLPQKTAHGDRPMFAKVR